MQHASHKSNWWTSGCWVLAVLGMMLLCWLVSLGYMSTLRMIGL